MHVDGIIVTHVMKGETLLVNNMGCEIRLLNATAISGDKQVFPLMLATVQKVLMRSVHSFNTGRTCTLVTKEL